MDNQTGTSSRKKGCSSAHTMEEANQEPLRVPEFGAGGFTDDERCALESLVSGDFLFEFCEYNMGENSKMGSAFDVDVAADDAGSGSINFFLGGLLGRKSRQGHTYNSITI